MRMLVYALVARLFVLLLRAAYGTPTDPVGLTIITVAYAVANFLNPIRALRAFTGGADPPGSGYVVTSDSTTTSSWKTIGAMVLAALGYTPLNKAGDTITPGGLSIAGALNVGGTTTTGPINAGAIAGSTGSFSSTVNIGGTTTAGAINASNISGAGGTFSGALSALSGAFTNALTAASATLTGALSAASATLSGALSAASGAFSGAVTAATMTATGLVKGSTLESTVGTGTAPLAVASTTVVSNLNVSALQGNAAAAFATSGHTHAYAQAAAGNYTGNGSSQTITVGFQPKLVYIVGNNTLFIVAPSGTVWASGAGVTPAGVLSGVTFTASGFVPAAIANQNAVGYSYVAIG